MVTDSRGHQVPAGSDSWGYREDMEQLSASITDVRSVADQADAEAAIADLEASDLDPSGTVWWLATPGALYVYDGTALVELAGKAEVDSVDARVPTGMHASSATATAGADATGSVVVTLPAGRFTGTATVRITATPLGVSPANFAVSVAGVSPTSFTLYVRNYSNSEREALVAYHAIQWDEPAALLASRALADTGDTGATVDTTVTCPTIRCSNQGIAIAIASHYLDDDGTTHPVDAVECGVCGTDLTDTLEAS